ncbi:hypothetical protein K1T71_000536 [Dendrolimus kikuchii]|uniref:Uncharacterized protein n=1 Tax=Dendrolimus kikuchii TaxID=765133 RepID=A0ACC1DJI7_9NEOP|nr:hypothetical protein K1T71_000536 [Dendrolimus kikuchii]
MDGILATRIQDGLVNFTFNFTFQGACGKINEGQIKMIFDTKQGIQEDGVNKFTFSLQLILAEAAPMSCAVAASQTSARVIVLPTVTGKTAKGLLRYRPNCSVTISFI